MYYIYTSSSSPHNTDQSVYMYTSSNVTFIPLVAHTASAMVLFPTATKALANFTYVGLVSTLSQVVSGGEVKGGSEGRGERGESEGGRERGKEATTVVR